MSKQEKIKSFNPNNIALHNSGIFGLPFNYKESELVILPLPWDVTVSYNDGTANAPEDVFQASKQVDLFDPAVPNAWQAGLLMLPINKKWHKQSKQIRKIAKQVIADLESNKVTATTNKSLLKINNACQQFHNAVEDETLQHINNNKIVIGLGGDHSTPYGIIKALATKHKSFGILQFDAHCDLRNAYEGFQYSHASIMYNIINNIPQVKKLTQVGIRDYCQDEVDIIDQSNGKINVFFDRTLKQKSYIGTTFALQTAQIISTLPNKVYISFDIDALDPKLCPNTGTPVAGGLELEQAVYIIEQLVQAKKVIIGADINEIGTSNTDWDANVGARLLFRLTNLIAMSNKII